MWGEAQSEGASGGPQEVDMDELVTVRESICLGPFQTEIIEGQARPLPPGLHILRAYMCLKNGSSRVSLVVRNMSDSHILLKKEVLVAHVVSVSPGRPTELLPEMEATLGTEAKPEPMSVMARQEKLLEKLNLDGLAHWSLRYAVVARELVLAYHDVGEQQARFHQCH